MDLDRKTTTFVRASSAVINELATTKPQGPSWKRDDWRAEMTQTAYHVLVAARAVVAAAEAVIEQMKRGYWLSRTKTARFFPGEAV